MALTKDEAIKVAKEWVENNTEAPTAYRGWNQFRSLMDQLALLCVAESLTNGEGKYQLCERLSKAHDILWSVKHAGGPEIWWKSGEGLSEATQKIVDKAKVTVWTRRDPKRSFEEGYESDHYTAFDPDNLRGTVADYLQEPWLRHAYLDWIMVDMMVSRELSAFGEELKKEFMPGPRCSYGFHAGYFDAKGNLRNMKSLGALKTLIRTAIAIGAPVGAIYLFVRSDLRTTLLILYTAIISAWLGLKVLRLIVWLGYAGAGKTHPRARPFVLWNEMYKVWGLLQGPVVNPTLVREMMAKTRDEGADWDQPAWSIVDRVIQHDPAVWVVQPIERPLTLARSG